jgi:hypothetical protein
MVLIPVILRCLKTIRMEEPLVGCGVFENKINIKIKIY